VRDNYHRYINLLHRSVTQLQGSRYLRRMAVYRKTDAFSLPSWRNWRNRARASSKIQVPHAPRPADLNGWPCRGVCGNLLSHLALDNLRPVGVDTDTVLDWDVEPPAPVQANVNLVAAVRFPVLWVPLIASEPLQPPDAGQEVAFVDDQVRVEAASLATVVGLADRVTVGAGAFTVTAADWAAVPPLPVQVRV
jgi:hypothetical protein